MERSTRKQISLLLLLLVALAACNDNNDCRDRPIYNHLLEKSDYEQLPILLASEYKFIHAVNDTIKDTVVLVSAGVDTKRTSLANSMSYYESSNCNVQNYDNIDTRKYLFTGTRSRSNSLLLTLMAARPNYYSSYYMETYLLDENKNVSLTWNQSEFSIPVLQLEGSGINYLPSVSFQGKTFTDVYRLGAGPTLAYINKQIIAHIRIGNETWTSF